jgi:hypothetical protein
MFIAYGHFFCSQLAILLPATKHFLPQASGFDRTKDLPLGQVLPFLFLIFSDPVRVLLRPMDGMFVGDDIAIFGYEKSGAIAQGGFN